MKRRPGPGLVALVSALLSLWACDDTDLLVVLPPAPPELPEGNSDALPTADGTELSPAEPSPAEVPAAPLPGIAEEEGVASGSAIETDRLARAVADVLSRRCGACHDGDRSDGGLGHVHDLAQLIVSGQIAPGSSAGSPLVQALLDGSMPPLDTFDRNPLSSGELALIARFVDQLPISPPAACAALPYRSNDEIHAALLADTLAAAAEDRPFLRYAGLTYASNAGLCGAALARQRAALFKLLNSVSTAPEIHVPEAIDSDGLLYRIDLRDYGWNRVIDLEDDGVPDFADGWLAAVAAAQPYGLELAGSEADELKLLTGATVPFLPANALVHALSAGDLYYALVGARGTGTETRRQLGVSLLLNGEDLSLRQGAFDVLEPWAERRVTRAEQSAHPGLYYWVHEEDPTLHAASVFQEPLSEFPEDGVHAIYNLPNGMQAYAIDGRGSSRVAMQLPCAPTTCEKNAPLLNGVDCHACHETGLVPVKDDVREVVEKYSEYFSEGDLAAIRIIYPGASEFGQLLAEGSQIHLDALQRAGVVPNGPEPISFVYYQFERTALGLRRAAGELGVTPEKLQSVITGPSGALGALLAPDGAIQRSAFDGAYLEMRCALEAESRNRPVACP